MMSKPLFDEQHQLSVGADPEAVVLDLGSYVDAGIVKLGNEDGCVVLDDRSFNRLVSLVVAKRKIRENLKRADVYGSAAYQDLEKRADALRLRIATHGWSFIESQGIAPEALSDPRGHYVEIEWAENTVIEYEEVSILDAVEAICNRLDSEAAE